MITSKRLILLRSIHVHFTKEMVSLAPCRGGAHHHFLLVRKRKNAVLVLQVTLTSYPALRDKCPMYKKLLTKTSNTFHYIYKMKNKVFNDINLYRVSK